MIWKNQGLDHPCLFDNFKDTKHFDSYNNVIFLPINKLISIRSTIGYYDMFIKPLLPYQVVPVYLKEETAQLYGQSML